MFLLMFIYIINTNIYDKIYIIYTFRNLLIYTKNSDDYVNAY